MLLADYIDKPNKTKASGDDCASEFRGYLNASSSDKKDDASPCGVFGKAVNDVVHGVAMCWVSAIPNSSAEFGKIRKFSAMRHSRPSFVGVGEMRLASM